MPTYAELAAEPWWNAEVESAPLAAFNTRLRAKFGHTRAQTGSKGDNRHLRGRHRSRNWCLNSHFCIVRSYGTTDARDKQGDGDWLRATDVGLTGTALREASARLDQAVRAGRLPLIAEWFGTVDGATVVGWYQGHASSSDDSHLRHLHLGYWTGMCDDADQFALLGDIITGEDEDMAAKDLLNEDVVPNRPWRPDATTNPNVRWEYAVTSTWDLAHQAAEDAAAAKTELAEVKAILAELGGTSVLTQADIEAAVRAALAPGLHLPAAQP